MLKTTYLAATLAASLIASGAFAQESGAISVEDAYARAASSKSMSGAVFMTLRNAGPNDDRLIAVSSDIAQRVELHTHLEDANGVMRMVEVEDGLPVPAGAAHMLMRGGDHVMLMGLSAPLTQGETVPLVLTFEHAGDLPIDVVVDNARKADHDHGS